MSELQKGTVLQLGGRVGSGQGWHGRTRSQSLGYPVWLLWEHHVADPGSWRGAVSAWGWSHLHSYVPFFSSHSWRKQSHITPSGTFQARSTTTLVFGTRRRGRWATMEGRMGHLPYPAPGPGNPTYSTHPPRQRQG